jgi:hypothetical protein
VRSCRRRCPGSDPPGSGFHPRYPDCSV